MWKPEYARRFLVLLDRFPNTLTASFAAHTHMDEFRLIGHGDHMRSFTLSTPGISPIFGQNPGFHVYDFALSGRLLDRTMCGFRRLRLRHCPCRS
jgi:sphingomyelin phosphodiesterase acid-like 3